MINQAQGIIIDQKWTYMWLCIKSVKAKLHVVAIIWNPSCHCPSAHSCSLLLLLLSFCTLDSRVWSVPLLSGWLITRGMTMVVITCWIGLINATGSSEKFRIWLKLPKQLIRPFNYFNYATSNFLHTLSPVLKEMKMSAFSGRRWNWYSIHPSLCEKLGICGCDCLAGREFWSRLHTDRLLLPADPLHAWHLSLPLINRWKLLPCA